MTLAQVGVVVVRPLSAGLVLSGVWPTEVGVHGPVLATGVCAKWRNGRSVGLSNGKTLCTTFSLLRCTEPVKMSADDFAQINSI